MEGDVHILNRSVCKVCGKCTTECYAAALELIGKEASVVEVVEEVMRDKPFYETSGGGITLSGGEPMMQIEFTEALLRSAEKNKLHTCMETCGFSSWEHYERVLPVTDLFLADVKEMIPARHRDFTGVDNVLILQNIRKLHDAGKPVILRLPIIPGYNDRDDHFAAVAQYALSLPKLCGVEIMPYHQLGTSKVGRLGLNPARRERSYQPDGGMQSKWINFLEERGVRVLNKRPADQKGKSANDV